MRVERRHGRSRRRRAAHSLAAAIAAALAAAALPAAAGATDYCVDTGCGGTNVATFEEAIDLADNAADADRIFLGAATYTAPTMLGFGYYQSSAPVEIVGQGTGQTILTSQPGANAPVLGLVGGAGSSVHDLTIRLPQNAAAGLRGLFTNAVAQRIEVVEHPTQTNYRSGVSLGSGAALEDSSVTLNSAQATNAVEMDGSGGTVRRSVLNGRTGVTTSGGGTIERTRITASTTGVDTARGLTTIAGSAIRITGDGAGIWAAPEVIGHNATVSADGVTIVGPGLPDTDGASASTFVFPAQNAEISLTNSIIRGFSTPLEASTPATGTGHATVAASYSDYDAAGNSNFGPNASISEANVSNLGDAGFVDAAGGDYHLLPSSPLLDRGEPATAQGLDLDGNPLVADGDGDGNARRDLGAFELQPTLGGNGQPPSGGGQQGGGAGQQSSPPAPDTRAPLVSRFRAAPSVFAVARARTPLAPRLARGTRFRFTLSEAASVTLKIQRAVSGRRTHYRTRGALSRSAKRGPNIVRFGGRLGKRALRPGRYRVRITATDAADNRSAPRIARFRIARS
jgi:hypothetical protein